MAKQTTSELLSKRLQLARQAQDPKWSLFTDLDEIYHTKGKPQESEGQVHAPDSWANVETVAPRMVARRPTLIFKPRPDPLYKARTDEQRSKTSDLQAALWDYWWDKDGAFVKNVAWVKGSLRQGTKIIRTYWKYEEQEITDYAYGTDGRPMLESQLAAIKAPAGEDGLPVPVEPKGKDKFAEETRTEVTCDDACMETISNYDFFIDPEAKDIQSAAWVIFRYRKTIDELRGYKQFKDLDKVEDLVNSKEGPGNEYQERSRIISGVGVLEDDSTIERITCYEMWQRGAKGIESCTVAAGKVEIEPWKPNKFRHKQYPFIRLVDSLVDEEFWGKGEIEPVMALHYGLDTYHSLDISNRVQALERKWKITGNVDEWEVMNSPYVHVDSRDGSDVEPFDVPDLTGTSGPAMESSRQVMSAALGIFDVNRGDSPGGNTTASGISTVAEQGNARFNMKIQLYEEALKELGFQVISLYQQHKTDYFQIEIEDDNGQKAIQTVAPFDIAGQFSIEVESGSSRPANREAERQDRLQLYQLLAPRAQQDPQFALELDKFVLDSFDNTGELEDEMEQSYERVQQMQQQAQAQQEQMMREQQAQQQGQQEEQGAAEDHQAKLSYFEQEEAKINDQLKQAQGQGNQEAQLQQKYDLAGAR